MSVSALNAVFAVLNRVQRWSATLCTWFGTVLLMFLSVVVLVGVFARFVLNMPIGWSEEIPKYCMVWLTFVGAPAVMYHASHVAIDGWYAVLPPRLRHLLRLAGALVCCAVLGVFVWYGWRSALMAQNQKIVIMNNMSMFWVYLSVPLGSALFFYACALRALKSLVLLVAPALEQYPQLADTPDAA